VIELQHVVSGAGTTLAVMNTHKMLDGAPAKKGLSFHPKAMLAKVTGKGA
jgi:hypothetical protein